MTQAIQPYSLYINNIHIYIVAYTDSMATALTIQ